MKIPIYTFTLIILLVLGCKPSTSNTYADMLAKPPYYQITDSINDDTNNDTLYIIRGLRLQQNEELEASLADFEKAYKLAPTATNATLYISSLLTNLRYDSANSVLQKIIKKYPDNNDFKEIQGNIYQKQNQFANALQVYTTIIAADKNNLKVLTNMGFCYQELDSVPQAIKTFERSYSLQPTATVGYELADMYTETLNPNTINFCQQLMKADTGKEKSVHPLYCIGRYHYNTKNFTEAINYYNQCITNDYTYIYAYLDKAEILLAQNKIGEAIKVLTKAKEIDNQNSDAYYLMGACLKAQGKQTEARLEFQRALALDKNNEAATDALNEN